MAIDKFDRPGDLNSPAYYGAAVTPSDSTDMNIVSRALYVGGAGNLSVVMAGDGATVVFTAVPAGTVLPISVMRVNATGTTATNVTAIW